MKTIALIVVLLVAGNAQAVTCNDMARVAGYIKESHDNKVNFSVVKHNIERERVGVYTRETYMLMAQTVYYSKGWPENYSETVLQSCLEATQ